MLDPLVRNLLRPPRAPHRRERAIVPGARRLAPPEGRLTLCLLNERGKVIHRTEAVNSPTNQLREAAMTYVRGNDATGLFGIGGAIAVGDYGAASTDNGYGAVGSAYPHVYAQMRQFLAGLYLSSSAAAVDDDWWYPLGLEAGARLDANNSFTDNKRRGDRVTANAVRAVGSNLYVVDFGLDIANGFSIESVGLAGLRFPGTDTYDGVYGWHTANMIVGTGSNGTVLANARWRCWAPVPGSDVKVWMLGEDGSFELDFSLSQSWQGSAVRSITGPSVATWGSPSAANSGIAIVGSDFWMMDTTRLRRFNIPTSSTLPTLHNTYSPVTGFTDAACLGLATDGTDLYALGSTKVFVISTSTGAVTSSWTHNVSSARNISYDPVMGVLWILGGGSTAYSNDGHFVGLVLGAYGGDIVHQGSGNIGFQSPMPFSKTGTPLGYGYQPWWSGSIADGADVFAHWDGGRYVYNCAPGILALYGSLQSGGVLGTRAIVDSPFTKTSANPLRVEYEVEFLP